jgi:hypothetical protein
MIYYETELQAWRTCKAVPNTIAAHGNSEFG